MTQVLIPYTYVAREPHLPALIFESFYGLETDVGHLNDRFYFIIHVNDKLGKAPAITFAKGLGLQTVLFLKNGVLFEKYCDTGIVERMGEVTLEDNVYKLTGV